VELHELAPSCPTQPDKDAVLLVLRRGVEPAVKLGELSSEIQRLREIVDKKAFMKGRVVNKHARWNLCFGNTSQEPDYEAKRGRIVAFSDMPKLSRLRDALPDLFGESASQLLAELNFYYDVTQCGIGFHGDTERKRVIGVRLGASIPLHYQWFQESLPIGERIIVPLHHGDIYLMSEKAVGFDWKRKKIPTLRHATGCRKFTDIVA
jgi:hypothetical protein